MSQWIRAFWQFSRPHTIYGTTISLVGLYALALEDWRLWLTYLPALGIGLLACLCANVYIVGLNQLVDVEIDRINKPTLPLASGALSYRQGVGIVVVTGILAILVACWQIPFLLLTVVLSALIGTAYSLPPIRLKRFPVAAALCIYGVRGWIVNLGLFAYVRSVIQAPIQLTPELIGLTLFISVFGLVIAIFKDIPDMEGDQKFQISTFSLQFGQQLVFDSSVWILSACYVVIAGLGAIFLVKANLWILIGIHLLGLGILLSYKQKTDVRDRIGLISFYQLIWKLFYLEYLLYPLIFIR